MVNRIPNGSLLTNKLGLLNSLQEYAKVNSICIDCNLHLLFCIAKRHFVKTRVIVIGI